MGIKWLEYLKKTFYIKMNDRGFSCAIKVVLGIISIFFLLAYIMILVTITRKAPKVFLSPCNHVCRILVLESSFLEVNLKIFLDPRPLNIIIGYMTKYALQKKPWTNTLYIRRDLRVNFTTLLFGGITNKSDH